MAEEAAGLPTETRYVKQYVTDAPGSAFGHYEMVPVEVATQESVVQAAVAARVNPYESDPMSDQYLAVVRGQEAMYGKYTEPAQWTPEQRRIQGELAQKAGVWQGNPLSLGLTTHIEKPLRVWVPGEGSPGSDPSNFVDPVTGESTFGKPNANVLAQRAHEAMLARDAMRSQVTEQDIRKSYEARPGYVAQEDLGDVQTQAAVKAAKMTASLIGAGISTEKVTTAVLEQQRFKAAQSPATYVREQFYQNELQKSLQQPVEKSAVYHYLTKESGLPYAPNPYEPQADINVEILKGKPTKESELFSPLSGVASAYLKDGKGVQQVYWDQAVLSDYRGKAKGGYTESFMPALAVSFKAAGKTYPGLGSSSGMEYKVLKEPVKREMTIGATVKQRVPEGPVMVRAPDGTMQPDYMVPYGNVTATKSQVKAIGVPDITVGGSYDLYAWRKPFISKIGTEPKDLPSPFVSGKLTKPTGEVELIPFTGIKARIPIISDAIALTQPSTFVSGRASSVTEVPYASMGGVDYTRKFISPETGKPTTELTYAVGEPTKTAEVLPSGETIITKMQEYETASLPQTQTVYGFEAKTLKSPYEKFLDTEFRSRIPKPEAGEKALGLTQLVNPLNPTDNIGVVAGKRITFGVAEKIGIRTEGAETTADFVQSLASPTKGQYEFFYERPELSVASFASMSATGAVVRGGVGLLGKTARGEKFITKASPVLMKYGGPLLGGIYEGTVAYEETDKFADITPKTVARIKARSYQEGIPGAVGFGMGYSAPGTVYKSVRVSDINYKAAVQEGAATGRFDYYVKQPAALAYDVATMPVRKFNLEYPQFVQEGSGARGYLTYKAEQLYRPVEISVKARVQEFPGQIEGSIIGAKQYVSSGREVLAQKTTGVVQSAKGTVENVRGDYWNYLNEIAQKNYLTPRQKIDAKLVELSKSSTGLLTPERTTIFDARTGDVVYSEWGDIYTPRAEVKFFGEAKLTTGKFYDALRGKGIEPYTITETSRYGKVMEESLPKELEYYHTHPTGANIYYRSTGTGYSEIPSFGDLQIAQQYGSRGMKMGSVGPSGTISYKTGFRYGETGYGEAVGKASIAEARTGSPTEAGKAFANRMNYDYGQGRFKYRSIEEISGSLPERSSLSPNVLGYIHSKAYPVWFEAKLSIRGATTRLINKASISMRNIEIATSQSPDIAVKSYFQERTQPKGSAISYLNPELWMPGYGRMKAGMVEGSPKGVPTGTKRIESAQESKSRITSRDIGGRTTFALTKEPSLKSLGISERTGSASQKQSIGQRYDFRNQPSSPTMKPMDLQGTKQAAVQKQIILTEQLPKVEGMTEGKIIPREMQGIVSVITPRLEFAGRQVQEPESQPILKLATFGQQRQINLPQQTSAQRQAQERGIQKEAIMIREPVMDLGREFAERRQPSVDRIIKRASTLIPQQRKGVKPEQSIWREPERSTITEPRTIRITEPALTPTQERITRPWTQPPTPPLITMPPSIKFPATFGTGSSGGGTRRGGFRFTEYLSFARLSRRFRL